MFRLSLFAIFAFAGACLAADATTIPEIEGPRAKYQKALADIRAKREQDTAPVTKTYRENLARLHERFAGEGDTAAAEAVKAEQDRIVKGVDPTLEELRAMTGPLRVSRNAYERERDRAYTEASKMEAKAHAAWAAGLAQLQAHLTKAGDHKKAALVQAERSKLNPQPAPVKTP